jgi:menaquinone-dependent protoporphyrinogen oxidase
MKVLVAYSSKHGATREIAEVIKRNFHEQGLAVHIMDVQHIDDLSPFGAVVLGSAVYGGRWRPAARQFVEQFSDELAKRPVWLFSSGPLGEVTKPTSDKAVYIVPVFEQIGYKEHRLFGGRLDRSKLNFEERAITFALHSTEGDFRDWGNIAEWTVHIAETLKKTENSDERT